MFSLVIFSDRSFICFLMCLILNFVREMEIGIVVRGAGVEAIGEVYLAIPKSFGLRRSCHFVLRLGGMIWINCKVASAFLDLHPLLLAKQLLESPIEISPRLDYLNDVNLLLKRISCIFKCPLPPIAFHDT